MKTLSGIAAASLLAISGGAIAQNQPGEALTPPGDSAPTEPHPEQPAPVEVRAVTETRALATDASQSIAANVVAVEQLSTLESAVVAADLAGPLGGAGPFTVFAPDNAAFGLVRAEALQQLMQPANRAALSNILQAHVVAGRVSAADLVQQIQSGGGRATLTTIGGDTLTATLEGQVVVLSGANNSRAAVTQADANASNGIIHIVNGVLLPAD